MSIKGAILGDILASAYEFKNHKKATDFNKLLTVNSRFTDDTVMTLAIKKAFVDNIPFQDAMRELGNKYIDVGYGSKFKQWLKDKDMGAYQSYGNGSAMRVSFIADHFESMKYVSEFACRQAIVTHNHPEGIKGAVVTAICIWMAKQGYKKNDILKYAKEQYPFDVYEDYSCEYNVEYLKSRHHWNCTCMGTVGVALRCALEATSYKDFMLKVISIGGDSDTMAAIGGSIAEELYGFDDIDVDTILNKYLTSELIDILNAEVKYTKYEPK